VLFRLRFRDFRSCPRDEEPPVGSTSPFYPFIGTACVYGLIWIIITFWISLFSKVFNYLFTLFSCLIIFGRPPPWLPPYNLPKSQSYRVVEKSASALWDSGNSSYIDLLLLGGVAAPVFVCPACFLLMLYKFLFLKILIICYQSRWNSSFSGSFW
jgi:hypothetical protein